MRDKKEGLATKLRQTDLIYASSMYRGLKIMCSCTFLCLRTTFASLLGSLMHINQVIFISWNRSSFDHVYRHSTTTFFNVFCLQKQSLQLSKLTYTDVNYLLTRLKYPIAMNQCFCKFVKNFLDIVTSNCTCFQIRIRLFICKLLITECKINDNNHDHSYGLTTYLLPKFHGNNSFMFKITFIAYDYHTDIVQTILYK